MRAGARAVKAGQQGIQEGRRRSAKPLLAGWTSPLSACRTFRSEAPVASASLARTLPLDSGFSGFSGGMAASRAVCARRPAYGLVAKLLAALVLLKVSRIGSE